MATTIDGFTELDRMGFNIATRSFGEALINYAFPEAARELADILEGFRIPTSELIAGGGGEATLTQRLRRALSEKNWRKHEFYVSKTVDGVETVSQTHEVDHVKRFSNGTLALEIEWNNKDPFFDRDLENFSRLHADNVIALGVIITRGLSMQQNFKRIVTEYAYRHSIKSIDSLDEHLRGMDRVLTPRQRKNLCTAIERTADGFEQTWADLFVRDKYGHATTHWDKLEARLSRGVGSPCPFIGIGLPVEIIEED